MNDNELRDNELRERIALALGWTRKHLAAINAQAETGEPVLWITPDGRVGADPNSLPLVDARSAISLLELCAIKGGIDVTIECATCSVYGPRVNGIRTGKIVNERNIIEACVLALESKQ